VKLVMRVIVHWHRSLRYWMVTDYRWGLNPNLKSTMNEIP